MKQNYLSRFLIFICLYLIGASSYSQNSYTFTSAGAAGRFGPTQEQVNSAYTGTSLEGKVVINTQGIQEWIVPVTGNYSLNALGASGGYAKNYDVAPGLGAAMYGEFALTAGQVLKIAVGQKGGNGPGAGSGGGGTFIVLQDNSPLIVAGGGGGQQYNGPVQPYQHGSTSTSGQNTAYVNGGQNGLGGEGDTYNGAAGGGGLLSDGGLGFYGTNGLSFLNGAIGGDSYDFYPEAAGGFGGGGGTHGNSGGGGGGGGYSGGAGGRHDAIGGNGGGGGSFNSGLNQLNTTGVNAGDGAVTITLLCSPLIITQSSTDVQCPGTSVTLTATSNNGGNVTWDNGVENGVPFDITETTTFTASSDNYLDCSQSVTVTVEDTEDPFVQTQNITVQLDSMGNATITPEMIDNGSTDSCSIANMSLNISSFDCSNIGANTVILTVEDNSGNTSSAEATVTVQDNLAPIITCQSNIEVDNDSGISGAVVTWTDPVAMDNCLTTIPGQGLNILFTREHIAGNGDLLEVPNELSSDGHNVTIAINDNWTALTGDLSGYDLIVWDATMLYNYSLTQSDYDNLESWVQEGGNLLVTGYDVVFTPEIVAFLGGASGADFGGNNNLTVLGPGNSLTTGVYDIIDTTIFGVNDWDALNGPYSLGVVDIVGAGRWTLRTISGGGQIAWMTSSYLPNGIWNTPGTGYYEALKNFAFNTSSSGVNVSQIAGLPSGSEFPVGTTTNTFEAIDAHGNKSTCSFDVTVKDVEAPAGYSVSIDQTKIDETNETSVSFTFTNAEVGTTYNYTLSSDNGGSEVTGYGTITTANDQITGIDVSGLNDGTLTLSVTLTDTSSNEGVAATDTIFKETNAAPVAVCKAFTAQLSADGSITITPADVDGGSSDDKTGFSLAIDKNTFDCSNLGDNQVELTVTDSDGITATCTATVTVEDNVAPLVTTVGTLTVQLDENGEAAITADDIDNGSTDNCAIDSRVLDITTFDCTNVGTPVVVTLTVTDVNGNSKSGTATVTVEDNVAPVVTTVGTLTVELDENGEAAITADDIDNGSTDNCAIDTRVLDITSFDCTNVGTSVVVTLTVTDVNGNSETGTATVTVEDNVAPVVTTIGTLTVELDENGEAAITADDIDNGSTDHCAIDTRVLDITTFDCTNVGTPVTVTLTVTDVNGNSETGTATVTVEDNVAPVVSTVGTLTVQLDENGEATITADDIDNGSTDNCAIDTRVLDITSFDCTNVGTSVVVTLTVTDVNGNSETGTATVTVEDNVAPVVSTVGTLTVQLDENGEATITADDIDNGSTDNCAIDTRVLDITTFDCTNVGTPVAVTLTVTDVNGNSKSGTATVTVADSVVPEVFTQDITVQLDAEGEATITPEMIDKGSDDSCGISEMSLDNSTFDCSNVGANIVTLTVFDSNGNSSSAEATVTVEDSVNPGVVTQNITVQLDAEGKATITPEMIDNGSDDACGISDMSLDNSTFDCSNVGANTVILTVIDNNGNSGSAEATVTVEDNIAPVLLTRDISIPLSEDGTASITAEDVVESSSDNCAIKSITLSEDRFDCATGAKKVIVVTLTDVNGNISTAPVTVTIFDETAPVVITRDIVVTLDESGVASISPEDVYEDAFDNCGISSMSLNITSFGCEEAGTNFVVLSVTDFSGNTGTAEAIVTVENNFGDNDSDDLQDNCDPDDDNDGVNDEVDNSPNQFNPDQTDTDGDGEGDVSDPDDDEDGILDEADNCPLTYNPDQGDINKDGKGDVCDTVQILVSEAMTPNGDGINDTWRIINIENYQNSLVIVYNRWGNEVFRAKAYKNDWNGNYNGDMLPEGSYYYQVYLNGSGNMDQDGWIYLTK